MSSGALPFATYHRASQLGSGSFGSVVCVYNEDGEEYAMKIFVDDEEDDDDVDNYDSEQDDEDRPRPLSLDALREVSALRLLRDKNSHPNIATLVDVQPQWEDETEEGGGAGTAGSLGIALPLYRGGSLQTALDNGMLRSLPKRSKVALAHGMLSSVAFLHDNDIIHRDIKPDNIMLEHPTDDNDTDSHSGDCWRPVLIDFSCAKQIQNSNDGVEEETDPNHLRHTGEVGTVTYTAPEVVAKEPYGKPSDLYSVGVVLLEVLLEQPLQANKNRHAATCIANSLEELNDQPFPNLLRGLLHQNPEERLTAHQALEHDIFAKFNFPLPEETHAIDIAEALPLEESGEEEEDDGEKGTVENESPNNPNKQSRSHRKRSAKDKLMEKREKFINSVCRQLDCRNPVTKEAALEYCHALSILDDTIDDTSESQSLLNCAVLAYRFFELKVLNLEELDDESKGIFSNWSLVDYVDDEATIFMILDFCLYPRNTV